jgi:hypothetical protein
VVLDVAHELVPLVKPARFADADVSRDGRGAVGGVEGWSGLVAYGAKRLIKDVGENVEAPAVRHPELDALDAELRGALDERVQPRDDLRRTRRVRLVRGERRGVST